MLCSSVRYRANLGLACRRKGVHGTVVSLFDRRGAGNVWALRWAGRLTDRWGGIDGRHWSVLHHHGDRQERADLAVQALKAGGLQSGVQRPASRQAGVHA